MAGVELEIIIDDRQLRRDLDRMPGAITNALRLATEDTTLYWQRIMQTYPPVPASRGKHSYVRTGTLGRSWLSPDSRRVEVSLSVVTGRTSSSGDIAPYNRYVQDSELQARIHQGRWEPMQQVMLRTTPQVLRFYENRMQALR